jgi:hypothetical protein
MTESKQLQHFPFPKIYSFKDVVRDFKKNLKRDKSSDTKDKKLIFLGLVKMHGTNTALVQLPNKFVYGQGRNRIMTLETGNQFRFAEWYTDEKRAEAIANIMYNIRVFSKCPENSTIVLYGEFCGDGVQKKVAISKIATHSFFAFACKIVSGVGENQWLNMRSLADYIEDRDHNIYNLACFDTYKVEISSADFAGAFKIFDDLARQVENQCPVSKALGLEGRGEGIVFATNSEEGSQWLSNVFKAKGPLFVDTKERDVKDVEQKMESAQSFLERAITEVRMNKSLDAIKETPEFKQFTMSNINAFITWLVEDIKVEEKETVCKIGFRSGELKTMIGHIAVPWFKKNVLNM